MPEFNPAHEIFINEIIAHGHRQHAYRAAYPDCAISALSVSASRLLAKPEIARRIREGLLEARKQAMDTCREIYQGRLTDKEEKRVILAQIARGELTTEEEVTKNNETKKIKKQPCISERLKAIALDNKMEVDFDVKLYEI